MSYEHIKYYAETCKGPRGQLFFHYTCSLLALKFRSISMARRESAKTAYIRGVHPLTSRSLIGASGPSCWMSVEGNVHLITCSRRNITKYVHRGFGKFSHSGRVTGKLSTHMYN